VADGTAEEELLGTFPEAGLMVIAHEFGHFFSGPTDPFKKFEDLMEIYIKKPIRDNPELLRKCGYPK